MTLDSDSKAKSDDSNSSHDSKSLDSGLGYIRVKIGHISPSFGHFEGPQQMNNQILSSDDSSHQGLESSLDDS